MSDQHRLSRSPEAIAAAAWRTWIMKEQPPTAVWIGLGLARSRIFQAADEVPAVDLGPVVNYCNTCT